MAQAITRTSALFCEETDATKIQNLLQPYIRQISTLSITFEQVVDQPELLLDDLPALQELAIQGGLDSHIYIPAIPQSISQLPSTLRSLKVVDRYFDTMRLTSLGPVVAHLTNFDIATLQHLSSVLHLLQLCPNLSSFKVNVRFDDKGEHLESFTHTKIQTFRIRRHCSFTENLSGLFNALSLPSLRVLEDHCNYGVSRPHEELKAFLARSKCPLETLIFSGWDMPMVTDMELEEYLDLIPSLEILLVEDRAKYSY